MIFYRGVRGTGRQHARPLGRTLLPAVFCTLWLVFFTGGIAAPQMVLAEEAAVRPGGTLPVYLRPESLAEANQPTADLAASSFWLPGPERFYGWAVRDLRDYLEKATNARFPLTVLEMKADRGVFVGTFDQFPDFRPRQDGAEQAFASRDPEAFVVEVRGGKLFILGRSNLGVMAAIYTLLDNLGCKWFAPGEEWENVPELDGLTLDDRLNAASAGPSYQARFYFSSWGPNSSVRRKGERERDYMLWNLRNRMGGSAYTANFHNDPGMVPPDLFEQRPELFALVKGERTSYALSRAHPETVAMAVSSAVKYLKENEGRGSYYDSFSVETNDGSPACEWSLEKIARDMAGQGNATDLNYWFANQVAAGLDKAGLTDKWVGMCSYSDHAGVPSFDLHPRVAVQVTTGLDFSSGMTVEERLAGLRRRKANRLGLYHYLNLLVWSLDRPGGHPAANPLAVAADLKRWHGHGAVTYMAETSDSWINGGPGHYLVSRVLWDVNCDPAQELRAYYEGAFGPAAGELRALHEDWARFQGKYLPRFTRGDAVRWHRLIAEADRLLADKPAWRGRVNDTKRYYLYLNYIREFDLDLKHPGMPSREERLTRMVRYLGSNRGEGAFHALGLVPTWLAYMPPSGVKIDLASMGPEFVALTRNINDENAWKAFPPLTDSQIDEMFKAAKLPADGRAAQGAVLDPAIKVFPADAEPPQEIVFPKLHGPPTATGPRHYVIQITAPTPKLTFHVAAGTPLGGGSDKRTCTVTGDNGDELRSFEFEAGAPVSFELTDVRPGLYTAVFPEFGAEQLTVSGGNALGAVRVLGEGWGFNPFRPAGLEAGEAYRAYFLVPAGTTSLKVRLSAGTVSLGFQDGPVIAPELKGSAELQKDGVELAFPASDQPRKAYIAWNGEFLMSEQLVIDGIHLYSPDPAYVFYETLD